ncbi:hypothetical protein GF325_02115 [Candidatus Bathyarchaeota archaeon]|nr:hypothetical protein [Candidatus Bathyarchaeota archaeon]
MAGCFNLGEWLRHGGMQFMLRDYHNYMKLQEMVGAQADHDARLHLKTVASW